ncbi:uncharacterized protein LOC131670660 isoform X2 [Phymastichus coffea]|nr:uncharacterized protein LOC131670660 isoform X2 [Phymastichus coffea]
MCESLEVVRILDVNETLLKTRCRRNSAIPSLSIMARIRLPEKIENKPATTPIKVEQRTPSTSTKMASSLSSLSSDSYSSSPETNELKFPLNISDIISSVNNIILVSSDDDKTGNSSDENEGYACEKNIVDSDDGKFEKFSDEDDDSVHTLKFVYERNIFTNSDEDSEKDNDKINNGEDSLFHQKSKIFKLSNGKSSELSENNDENDDYDDHINGLIERGPVRPQLHSVNRSKPYVESAHQWPSSDILPSQPSPSENSTDYDTSAKAILTDKEYRQRIDLCLDQLSDMGQDQSVVNSLSPGDSDFGGTLNYSPQQPYQWQPDQSPNSVRSNSSSTYFVPSIKIGDSESTILEVLSRHSLQRPVYQSVVQTPDYNSGASTAACDNYPESPASSYNACATSTSRPESRASSRAQSPGSNNGGCASTGNFFNLLASSLNSPQVSPQNFRNQHRPSSSSSSSQSYCETPSPANYQNPLEQHIEEKLGDHMMTRMPAWYDSFKSSDTLVNSVGSSELQLQLVEEVIRGDMKDQPKSNDMQVVPNCQTSSSSTSVASCSMNNINPSIPSENYTYTCHDNETTDDLTNTLLRFVGSAQTIPSHRKVEARNNSSTTSGYNSNSRSNEARKLSQDSACLSLDQPIQTTFLESFRSPPRSQPQRSIYQQSSMSLSPVMATEALHFPTSPIELMGRNRWNNYPERNTVVANLQTYSKNFTEFQIPETVTSYNSQMTKTTSKSKTSGSERSIAPWPSLNLPSTRASERLKEVTDPREVERAMKNLLKQPLEKLAKTDDDGDTMLMCLVGNPRELTEKLAWLAPLVERMAAYENCLATLNHRGEDALYLAAMNCPQMAFVAGYLAAAFLQKKIDVGQRLYHSRGDTIVHALAAKGDAHGEVLAELLSLKTAQGNSMFDLSKRNYEGRTALHVAVEVHESSVRNEKTISIGTVRLLMENGADPLVREVRCGDTALHLAVSLSADPALVKMLLIGRGHEAVNVSNYNGNTPMHVIAAMSERTTLDRQMEVCYALIHAGARTNITNRQGKTALALVSPDRKDILRRIFHKKS